MATDNPTPMTPMAFPNDRQVVVCSWLRWPSSRTFRNHRRSSAWGYRRPSAFLLCCSFLAGCAIGPNYEKPAVEAPAAFKEASGEWVVAQPKDEVPKGKWWQVFNDPVLDELAEQVSVSNQTLRAAEARYTQSRAAVQSARAGLFPTLGASGGASRSRRGEGGTSTNYDIGLDARWEIDLWGRVRRLVEASRAGEQASAADLEAIRLSLQSELAINYFQLRVTDVQRQLLEDTVKAFQTSLQVTQNRYKAGVAARVDVVQAETQLKSTEAQALDLRVTRAQLEHAIAVLIGKAPSSFSLEPAKFDAQHTADPAGPALDAPRASPRRGRGRAARRRGQRAHRRRPGRLLPVAQPHRRRGLRQRRALHPHLRAQPRLVARRWARAATILDFGAARGQRRCGARAVRRDRRQLPADGARGAAGDRGPARRGPLARRGGPIQRDAARLARESVALTLNQYKAGTVSYLNVVQVQATQLNEERQTVQLLGRRLASTVALIRALGGAW